MSVTIMAGAVFVYLRSRIGSLARWMDVVLSEFPADDWEARCRAEQECALSPRDPRSV
jgi:hypothetical protein